MISRFRISLVLALTLALLLAIPVFAGGWAVITLDELPSTVIAGEPVQIGFTVRQHGKTPLVGIDATVTIQTGFDKLTFIAKEEGLPGHYVAELNFPTEGEWIWEIDAFGYEQPMPNLRVTGAVTTAANLPVAKTEALPTSPVVPLASLTMGALALIFAWRTKSRGVFVLAALCLTVGIGSLFVESAVPAVEAKRQAIADPFVSQVELGQRLFVAKGCITCHANTNVPDWHAYRTIEMGAPNLSNFSASPEILRIRLKDPALAKSDTQMPNLGLSDTEIEALIAFINSK
ncbi:MAG: c-type cytochrome [Anaerolineales bacterium]|nr:c-type cytochrome [Anaerolineales bacterium]